MTGACLLLLLWAKPTATTAKNAEGATTGFALTMPKQCQPGKTSPEPNSWRWRQGTLVRLYFLKGDFSRLEVEALSRAVKNWNVALREMDTKVHFILGGETETLSAEATSVTVTRGTPKGKERVGEIKLHSMTNGRVHLVMIISPEVTDPNALTSLMTHELGHTLGLADCYDCNRGTTAMAAFRGRNRGNEVYTPSECDRYVVAAGYRAGKINTQARAASSDNR